MAKETVKVDNGLKEIKLESREKMDKVKIKNSKGKNKKKDSESVNQESYMKSVLTEMKHVTWCSKKNLVKYSITTILMVVLFVVFFIGITAIFDLLYSLVQGWIG